MPLLQLLWLFGWPTWRMLDTILIYDSENEIFQQAGPEHFHKTEIVSIKRLKTSSKGGGEGGDGKKLG